VDVKTNKLREISYVKYTTATLSYTKPSKIYSTKRDAQETCSIIGKRREAAKDDHYNARDKD
jgi:hypothetical protein